MSDSPLQVLIGTYLEPAHIERIRAVSPRLHVVYEPDLLPPPRYPADHTNVITRTPEDTARWEALLAEADVLFDFDHTNRDRLPELAPKVRWIQATSAGIGQFVRKYRYDTRMPNTTFTTASGVHAQPLAEFCALAMLAFSRNLPRILEDQRERRWERYAASDLEGKTVGIIGVGKIGRRVAQFAGAMGMRVLGVKRHTDGVDPASLHLDALYGPQQMDDVLQQSAYVVLITPHTDETEALIGAKELALLPAGAVLINIGRGACVDEPALIAALQHGHLGGAALDVFATEPLPAESPLWAMPNVLVSPHSASTSDRENERIVDLFCANLQRYLAGEPLQNVLNTNALY